MKGSDKEEHNPVSNPHHYVEGGVSPLDLIGAKGMLRGFCLGNAIKYIGRAGKKKNVTEKEDLEKAMWYLRYYLEEGKGSERNKDNESPL